MPTNPFVRFGNQEIEVRLQRATYRYYEAEKSGVNTTHDLVCLAEINHEVAALAGVLVRRGRLDLAPKWYARRTQALHHAQRAIAEADENCTNDDRIVLIRLLLAYGERQAAADMYDQLYRATLSQPRTDLSVKAGLLIFGVRLGRFPFSERLAAQIQQHMSAMAQRQRRAQNERESQLKSRQLAHLWRDFADIHPRSHPSWQILRRLARGAAELGDHHHLVMVL